MRIIRTCRVCSFVVGQPLSRSRASHRNPGDVMKTLQPIALGTISWQSRTSTRVASFRINCPISHNRKQRIAVVKLPVQFSNRCSSVNQSNDRALSIDPSHGQSPKKVSSIIRIFVISSANWPYRPWSQCAILAAAAVLRFTFMTPKWRCSFCRGPNRSMHILHEAADRHR